MRRHRIRSSITVRQTKTIRAAIAAIPNTAGVDIASPPGGVAQVAEAPYRGDGCRQAAGCRLMETSSA
jgi:hypothetical protein